MTGFHRRTVTRRSIVKGLGVAGVGMAATASLTSKSFAQTKPPIKLSFWTYENPETRPWLHKRIKLFMEQNPNVQIDFQWFTFGDLGKKISVGFATGTAPDGFVSQDWFMPIWLAKGLLAPLDVQRLGYSSYDRFIGDYAKEKRIELINMVWQANNLKGYVTEMEATAMLKLAKDWNVEKELVELVLK